jgi:hypothetical protein
VSEDTERKQQETEERKHQEDAEPDVEGHVQEVEAWQDEDRGVEEAEDRGFNENE